MTDHPITPPPKLVQQWLENSPEDDELGIAGYIATQAARWGADQELEACCAWLIANDNPRWALALQEGRRPKPPSLKEQALESLRFLGGNSRDVDTIRRALEQLDD